MTVQVAREGHIEVITIDRPERRNAIDGATGKALSEAFDSVAQDEDVWVVVLTGAGNEAFCAGADLTTAATGEGGDGIFTTSGFAGITDRDLDKPLIAAVNGSALAGGMEIVLACDLVVAVEHATFGLPEVKWGIIAAAGGLVRLPRRVPLVVALEMSMTGVPVSAGRALELGLVNRVVPDGGAVDEALELARVICANAPLAVRASRRVARRAAATTEQEAWAVNREALADVLRSADAIEGPLAFAEKRQPRWTAG